MSWWRIQGVVVTLSASACRGLCERAERLRSLRPRPMDRDRETKALARFLLAFAAMLSTFLLLALVASPTEDLPSPRAVAPDAVRFEEVRYRDVIEVDGSRTRTMDMRVWLGNSQGVAAFGQIVQDYIVDLGEVKFEAIVITKSDGRLIEVKEAREEDVNPLGVGDSPFAADIRYRKLIVPGLEPGDTLSFRSVRRERALAPGHVFGQIKLPFLAGSVPQVYELDVPAQGGPTVHLKAGLAWEEVPGPPGRRVRRVTATISAPADAQKLSRSELEAWSMPEIVFTSFGSWNDVASWWWQLAKDRLAPSGAIADLAKEQTRGASTPREKVSALFGFVAGRVRYLNVSFGIGRMQPRFASSVLQNRYGDCKDKHALLAALAESVGLDVRPALVTSTRAGLRDDAPGPWQFDHVISVLRLGPDPSDWLWMDSTNAFAPPGVLSPAYRDRQALVIEPDGRGTRVRTPADLPFVARLDVTARGTLGLDNVLRARMTWSFHSDLEVQLRGGIAGLPQSEHVRFARALCTDWQDAKVENVALSDPADLASPLRVEFDVEQSLPACPGERRLWVPLPAFSLPDALDPVPPGDPAATFEVREVTMHAEIELAQGQAARAPLSVSLERPFGSFRSTYAVQDRKLVLDRQLKLVVASVSASDVPAYEAFLGAIRRDRKQEFILEGDQPAAATAAGLEGGGNRGVRGRRLPAGHGTLDQVGRCGFKGGGRLGVPGASAAGARSEGGG